jgi:enterochelin esterase-like enzyme
MKIRLFSFLSVSAMVPDLKTSITYTVTVPIGTNACFIAGEMNGWIHQAMYKVNATTYTLTIADATTTQQYNYFSGPSWHYVEKTASGADVPNRTFNANDVVERWALVCDPNGNVEPHVPSGSVRRFYFNSKFVDSRNIDVWLPNGYDSTKKYAVVYMQDGQMLFDSTITCNEQDWAVAETADRLMQQGRIRNIIVVGIWNNGNKRAAEYFPQKIIDSIPEPKRSDLLALMPGGPKADDYLRFLVNELKPFIDSTFSTYTDHQNTFIMGPSFGGLISLYAICEYPQIFSGAACMSTHWMGLFTPNREIPDAINDYLKVTLPSPSDHRIYYDYGSVGIDMYYEPYQFQVDTIMMQKGYSSTNWITESFPGTDHSEGSWAQRLDTPFVFLLENCSP